MGLWSSVASTGGVMTTRLYQSAQRGCVYCWGHGNDARIMPNPAYWNGIARDVAAAMPCYSSDFTGTGHWGDDAAIASVDAARTAFAAKVPLVSDKVLLLGISMGATLACNWARQHPTLVAAIALVNPAVNLADIHDRNANGYAAEIESVYGGLAAYQAALPTHDPSAYAVSLAGIPIKAWYSTDDPIVTASIVQSFAAAAGASAVSLGAVGHSPGSLAGADVRDFLAAHI